MNVFSVGRFRHKKYGVDYNHQKNQKIRKNQKTLTTIKICQKKSFCQNFEFSISTRKICSTFLESVNQWEVKLGISETLISDWLLVHVCFPSAKTCFCDFLAGKMVKFAINVCRF